MLNKNTIDLQKVYQFFSKFIFPKMCTIQTRVELFTGKKTSGTIDGTRHTGYLENCIDFMVLSKTGNIFIVAKNVIRKINKRGDIATILIDWRFCLSRIFENDYRIIGICVDSNDIIYIALELCPYIVVVKESKATVLNKASILQLHSGDGFTIIEPSTISHIDILHDDNLLVSLLMTIKPIFDNAAKQRHFIVVSTSTGIYTTNYVFSPLLGSYYHIVDSKGILYYYDTLEPEIRVVIGGKSHLVCIFYNILCMRITKDDRIFVSGINCDGFNNAIYELVQNKTSDGTYNRHPVKLFEEHNTWLINFVLDETCIYFIHRDSVESFKLLESNRSYIERVFFHRNWEKSNQSID